MKRPWMPLYIADFLKDTTHIGAIETGAYLLLIMHYWQNGKLPGDDRQLARIAKLTPSEFKRHRETLNAFFYDGWKHKRIDQELSHAVDVSTKRSAVAAARQAQLREQEDCKPSAIAPAIADTLHTSHFTQKEIGSADAPPDQVVIPMRPYAFGGRIIRLDQAALDRWRKTYHSIPDIEATLQSADDYYTENPPRDGKWFFPVSRWLEKEHNRIVAEEKKCERERHSF